MPRTLFDKVWDAHVVDRMEDGTCVLYIDRHLVHEVTSPQAFEGLRMAGRKVRRPDATIAVVDHNVPTTDRRAGSPSRRAGCRSRRWSSNVAEFGVPYIPLLDARQGIVHIIGPEQGISLPGTTIVCGDSHTSTHGAWARWRSASARPKSSTCWPRRPCCRSRPRTCWCRSRARSRRASRRRTSCWRSSARIGTAGGNGHVIEYAGSAIRALDMAGRMTVCNMTIEAGARAGMIAPDDTTFDYVRRRPQAPKGERWSSAIAYWRTLPSDAGAQYDRVVTLKAADIAPMVSWGTNPEAVLPITGAVPDPASYADPAQADQVRRMLDYMGLTPGQKLDGVPVDVGVHRQLHQRPHRGHARRRRRGRAAAGGAGRARDGRARQRPGEAAGGGGGPGPRVPGRRVRVAGGRLLHVPGHEPGQADGRASAAPARPTATSRAARGRAAAPTCCRRPWPPRRRSPAGWPTCGRWRDAGLHHPDRRGGAVAAGQRRHRQDHPGAVPQDHQAHRARRAPVRHAALRAGGRRAAGLRAEPAGVPPRGNPDRARELRLRLVARARAVGVAGFRHTLRDRAGLRRHLPQQLLQERHPAGPPAARGVRPADGGRQAGRQRPADRRPGAAGRGAAQRRGDPVRDRRASASTCC